jgi:hypothetical protein
MQIQNFVGASLGNQSCIVWTVTVHNDAFDSAIVEFLVDNAFEAALNGFFFAVSWNYNRDSWVKVWHRNAFSASIDLNVSKVQLITFSLQTKNRSLQNHMSMETNLAQQLFRTKTFTGNSDVERGKTLGDR